MYCAVVKDTVAKSINDMIGIDVDTFIFMRIETKIFITKCVISTIVMTQ